MRDARISDLQALMLSADPEGDLRSAYEARIAFARNQRPTHINHAGPRRILLVGYNGARNTGADLRTREIVRALRDAFSHSPVEWGVVMMGDGPPPNGDGVIIERIEGYPPDIVQGLCARYDAVLVCEGSLFTSTFSDSLAMLFIAFLGMAAAMGKPAVAYGAEADRMSPTVEAFARCCVGDALLIARNGQSQRRLAGIGLPAEAGTDTGWTYRPARPEAAEPALRAVGWNGCAKILALCPTNPFRWPLVADPARAMLASLTGNPDTDRHHGIMFFQPAEAWAPRCEAFLDAVVQAVRQYATQQPTEIFPIVVGMEPNDRPCCADLALRLGAPAPFVSDRTDPDLIVSILRAASILVSARYHAILLSMAAGVPAIGLAYDQRLPALLQDAGQPGLALDVARPDLASAIAGRLGRLSHDRSVGRDFARFADRQRKVQQTMTRRVTAYLRSRLD